MLLFFHSCTRAWFGRRRAIKGVGAMPKSKGSISLPWKPGLTVICMVDINCKFKVNASILAVVNRTSSIQASPVKNYFLNVKRKKV